MDNKLKKMLEKATDPENVRYPLFLILDEAVKRSLGTLYTSAEIMPMSRILASALKSLGISKIPKNILAELDGRIKKMAASTPSNYGGKDFFKEFQKSVSLFAKEIRDLKT